MTTWVWVRDTSTGHQYDVDERRLPTMIRRGVEVVEGVPRLDQPGAQPRPTKFFAGKDGEPALPVGRPQPPPPEPVEPEPEPATPRPRAVKALKATAEKKETTP